MLGKPRKESHNVRIVPHQRAVGLYDYRIYRTNTLCILAQCIHQLHDFRLERDRHIKPDDTGIAQSVYR